MAIQAHGLINNLLTLLFISFFTITSKSIIIRSMNIYSVFFSFAMCIIIRVAVVYAIEAIYRIATYKLLDTFESRLYLVKVNCMNTNPYHPDPQRPSDYCYRKHTG